MSQGQQQKQAAPAATATGKPASQPQSEFDKLMAREVTFTPFGEAKPITLNAAQVMHILAVKTKSGKTPTPADVDKFLKLCQARGLNPWVGDAFLLGYDTRDGAQFSLITSIQALLKRSEASPFFDGIMAGLIVKDAAGNVVDRDGAFKLKGDEILGAWCKVFRKDRSIPFVNRINFEVYNQGFSRWLKDPGGMIVKCAKAASLRDAFPTQIGGCYIDEEFQQEIVREMVKHGASPVKPNPSDLRSLTQRAVARVQEHASEASAPVMAAGELPVEEYHSPMEDGAPSLLERACASLRAATDFQSLDAIYDSLFGEGSSAEWTAEDEAVAKQVRDSRGKELMQ